ncbi:MAG: TonB-dependent receptor plug domain-containing protein, partial [Idiomarina loihiensis]
MTKGHKTTRGFAKSLLATAIFATLQATVYAADLAKPKLETDEILVVTGSRSKEKLEDVAGAVSVVTAEEIDIQVSNSLSDIFRYDPSISSTGSQGQAQTLSIRGIGGNRVVYIKDGRRLNDAYAGGGGYLVGRGYLDVSQLSQV